tara:strand:+ start:236 stop:460 length:225 start_codon:yes stop_codon:yes gene_type:complete
MAQQTMHAQMGGETGGPEELIQARAVTFGLEYRTLHDGAEEGVCIHVYSDQLEEQDKELIASGLRPTTTTGTPR